jgi:hypothetical protein
MPAQYTAKIFDEDNDVVHFFITGGNDNNGSVTKGQPALRIDPNTGIIQVMFSFMPRCLVWFWRPCFP